MGRNSIPPEKLLRAQRLMAFYTIGSERLLVEQIDYNLLFRSFVGFSMDDPIWHHSTPGLTRMPCCIARANAPPLSSATSDIC